MCYLVHALVELGRWEPTVLNTLYKHPFNPEQLSHQLLLQTHFQVRTLRHRKVE